MVDSKSRPVPVPIGEDQLQFKKDPEIMGQLESNESLVFSTKVLKFNRFGFKQERNLLLTTHRLANIKKKEFQRTIKISTIRGLSRSTSNAKDFDFIVHVKDEYDYRFICEDREKLFVQIKAVYFTKMNKNLPIYDVPDGIGKYSTSKKDSQANKEKIPPDTCRNYNEDVYESFTQTTDQRLSTASSSEDEDLGKYESVRPHFQKTDSREDNVSLSDFQIKKVIGRGSFGKVFLVQKKTDGKVFAMKSLRKDVILDYDQVESTKLEKDILLQANHPFLVGMSYVFMTEQKIFFVMRFVRGGELFMHLRQAQRFTEERAKFYAIQVAMAIGHLHDQKIIYRDLKPENILMDDNGYICLTDFGLAKVLDKGQQAYSFCGTPDYLAPEILIEKGHSFPVDWWAVGILTYEMIVGFPPFYTGNSNNAKMYQLIKSKPVYFPDPQRHQITMSSECQQFITALLEKDPAKRMGTKDGIREVLAHPWLQDIDHDKLEKCKIEAPFKPTLSGNVLDVTNFDKQFTQEEAVVSVIQQSKMNKVNANAQSFQDFC